MDKLKESSLFHFAKSHQMTRTGEGGGGATTNEIYPSFVAGAAEHFSVKWGCTSTNISHFLVIKGAPTKGKIKA